MIEVYEKGKPRIVSVDIMKEFRGENGLYGYPSDPPHPQIAGEEEMREIPSLTNTPMDQNPHIKTQDYSKYEPAVQKDPAYTSATVNREEENLVSEGGAVEIPPPPWTAKTLRWGRNTWVSRQHRG